ncbi:MAG: Ig-like domain-containing protein [Smithella sp.]
MKRFKTQQAFFALIMMLAVSVFLFTGCGSSDEAALVTAQFDNVLPGTCGEGGPKVDSATPANNTENVAIETTIMAYFSEAMDPKTIEVATPGSPDVETFTLYDNDYPGVLIEGTVEMDVTNTIATFKPTTDLERGTKYTVTITTYAKRLSDNTELGCNYRWEFQTVD